MSEETVELVNKLATSDLFRWYGYRFRRIASGIVYIEDDSGNKFQVAIYDGKARCVQCGNPNNHAKANWIKSVLNGASLECEAGQ